MRGGYYASALRNRDFQVPVWCLYRLVTTCTIIVQVRKARHLSPDSSGYRLLQLQKMAMQTGALRLPPPRNNLYSFILISVRTALDH